MKRIIVVVVFSICIGILSLIVMNLLNFRPLNNANSMSNALIIGTIYIIIAMIFSGERVQYDEEANLVISKYTLGEDEIIDSEKNNRLKDSLAIGGVGIVYVVVSLLFKG
jgi:hypothetical protein